MHIELPAVYDKKYVSRGVVYLEPAIIKLIIEYREQGAPRSTRGCSTACGEVNIGTIQYLCLKKLEALTGLLSHDFNLLVPGKNAWVVAI